jgi:hypothetical protein
MKTRVGMGCCHRGHVGDRHPGVLPGEQKAREVSPLGLIGRWTSAWAGGADRASDLRVASARRLGQVRTGWPCAKPDRPRPVAGLRGPSI